MNIYLVEYWVPFPNSEYGGLYVIAAENKEQVKQLCIEDTSEWDKEDCDFDNLKMEVIGTTTLYTKPQVIDWMAT